MKRLNFCVVSLAGLLLLSLSACGGSSSSDRSENEPVADRQVVNLLAPGQSGFVSTTGQAQGSASGDPGDFGEHLDDQRIPYWSFEYKPGEFTDITELDADEPIEGVRIYRDGFGVPIIYADTAFDVAFGMGYALTADRLFLQDGARRLARGTLAELTGPADVPADIEARVLTYSEAEYQAMYEALPEQPRAMVDGYVAGANAWIELTATDPSLLPAEYSLLTVTPEPFTVTDVLAAGVFITRAVASNGGNEFDNVAVLRDLESVHGREVGRAIFQAVHWVDDARAAVTVPGDEATFSNITTPLSQRDAVFNAMADFAMSLPSGLEVGMGTGDAAVPSPLPLPNATSSSLELGPRLRRMFNPEGGASYMAVVAPDRSTTGKAMLINGPQLGYGYPTQLMELEVHGAGFDARGSTAPLLPVIGIGYGEQTVWGVTTGNSKTIDSFIETLDGDDANRYLHDGEIKDMDCRDETINYRGSTGMIDGVPGVPVGPASFSTTVEVCRTVHGPVVARSDDGTRARSLQYAMWMREVETIFGVLDWMRVDDFDAFEAAMRRVTWNENTMYADADGNIAFWHPGLHPQRAPTGDQRFPLPGEGAFDHAGTMAFEALPQSVNPAQGYLANWNNKPAVGWGEGIGGQAGSTPAGADQRVTNWLDALDDDPQVSFEDILAMDRLIGIKDPRARAFVPVLTDYAAGDISERHAELLAPVLTWDQNHYRPDLDITDEAATDTVGATVFDVFVRELRTELFASWLPESMFQQMSRLGNHEYDVAPLDNLAIRILVPESSAITPTFDFLDGRSRTDVLAAALDRADALLSEQFGSADVATYTRVHHRDDLCSLTGVIGPCITMPHQDRGSWIHAVAFE